MIENTAHFSLVTLHIRSRRIRGWTPDHAHPIWSAAVTPHAWEFGERWRSWLDSGRSVAAVRSLVCSSWRSPSRCSHGTRHNLMSAAANAPGLASIRVAEYRATNLLGMPKESYDVRVLRSKAVASLPTGVTAFNGLENDGRVTTVLLSVQHAFEMLLKAILLSKTEQLTLHNIVISANHVVPQYVLHSGLLAARTAAMTDRTPTFAHALCHNRWLCDQSPGGGGAPLSPRPTDAVNPRRRRRQDVLPGRSTRPESPGSAILKFETLGSDALWLSRSPCVPLGESSQDGWGIFDIPLSCV